MARYTFAVFSIPVSGRESEMAAWYDQQHIPDILKLDGFVSARRYDIGNLQSGSDLPPWKTMVLYEIESNDIAETLAQIPAGVQARTIKLSGAVERSTALQFVAAPVSPVFSKND